MSTGPLRRILEGRVRDGLDREYLECGHIIMPPVDAYGPTSASRRRCRKCARGKPQDFDAALGPPPRLS